MKKYCFVAFIPFILTSCKWFEKENITPPKDNTPGFKLAASPDFNSDTAYAYVQSQVNFGPRSPNSIAHKKCAAWITEVCKKFADTVFVQKYTATGFDGLQLQSENIIASFNPSAPTRILLSAHWDTRPFADQDETNRDKPIDGANDAGSGVAVLLEIARVLHKQPVNIGVDLVFFDSEDYGQPSDSKLPQKEDSYCLGSQYWSAHPHVANYKADFGINLDMVGGTNSVFYREQNSVYNADWVSQYVWNMAEKVGFGSQFPKEVSGSITDDHLYVMRGTKIPCIDIIHYDHEGFHHSWHTHKDNMSIISKETLQAVGKTVLQTIFQYNAEKKSTT